MHFDPINDDHAIQTASFACVLDRALNPPDIIHLQNNHFQIRDDLPALGFPQSVNVEVSGPAGQPVDGVGIEFSSYRADGTRVWNLVVGWNQIVVHCTRYTRWDKTWLQAQSFINFALDNIMITNPECRVSDMVLSVTDRFCANTEDYDLRSLIKDNEFISPAVWRFGPVWHSHVGWFETVERGPVLNRLNIDARREVMFPSGGAQPKHAYFINIQHFQQSKFSDHVSIVAARSILDPVMRVMHVANKSIACRLLSDEIQQRIGLEGTL